MDEMEAKIASQKKALAKRTLKRQLDKKEKSEQTLKALKLNLANESN